MSQTPANLADVMKEVFTQERLEKQFFDEFRVFNRLQRVSKWTHGKKAVVPIHKGRSGGYSIKGSQGGTLNAADAQKVDRAEYTVGYNYQQIEIEVAALNEATGGGFSVGSSLNLEVEGALSDIRNQVERQFLGDGTGMIAAFSTNSNTTVLNLSPTGYGYDAIKAGWLYPGLKVDGGPTSNSDSELDSISIVSVTESSTDPEIVVAAADTTTNGTSFVSIAGAYDDGSTTCNESDGLRNIAGSSTGVSGTLNPATAGQEFWKPAHVDSTTTVLSINLLLTLQRKVHQKTGKNAGTLMFSLLQRQNFYELLQNQVRFDGDNVGAGADQSATWNGNVLESLPSIPDREVYFLTLEDLAVVTGSKIKQPTWVSSMQGANTGMIWKQGATSFVDSVVYPVGLATRRRNSQAAAVGLTA